MAAVFATGGVLSHRAAGALWGLRPYDGLEVTVPSYRARRGITVHTSCLPPDEATSVHAIPVTGPSRTLLDLAAVLPAHQVERAVNEAEMQRLTDSVSLPDLVRRYPRRPGIQTIKAILEAGPAFTRSELETRFVTFVRGAGLPFPLLNAPVLGFECDCVWYEQRVVVELDGHGPHSTRAAFERDRARDRILAAGGWRVVRVTCHDDAELLGADLRRIVAAWPPRPRARARAAAP
jgi:hypothetical protein